MLKLPVCPHCHAVYRYGEVKKLAKYKKIQCRHCNKIFYVSSVKGKAIYIGIICALLIMINIFMFNVISNITVYHCLIVNVVIISLSLLWMPFTVKFKKLDVITKKDNTK
ncbi:MAG TPA: hypothetical protein GX401_08630 [Clostridiales bacterium]|nr:hypothetical protein [Clostridiales bacterium]